MSEVVPKGSANLGYTLIGALTVKVSTLEAITETRMLKRLSIGNRTFDAQTLFLPGRRLSPRGGERLAVGQELEKNKVLRGTGRCDRRGLEKTGGLRRVSPSRQRCFGTTSV